MSIIELKNVVDGLVTNYVVPSAAMHHSPDYCGCFAYWIFPMQPEPNRPPLGQSLLFQSSKQLLFQGPVVDGLRLLAP